VNVLLSCSHCKVAVSYCLTGQHTCHVFGSVAVY